ncbi:Hypothetical predicted protein, partial [Podarcis lilfordi]
QLPDSCQESQRYEHAHSLSGSPVLKNALYTFKRQMRTVLLCSVCPSKECIENQKRLPHLKNLKKGYHTACYELLLEDANDRVWGCPLPLSCIQLVHDIASGGPYQSKPIQN